jgi:hypothetical protein
MIPAHYRERRPVAISDIRNERMTEADARELLSTWVIQRFEKLDDDEIDDEGFPLRPTWENVIRTEVRDLSKQEATRQVRTLDRMGQSVAEKKASLSTAQQRQLERAQEELQRFEPDQRYIYILAQLDHQLKKLDHRPVEYYGHKGKNRESKHVTVGRRRSSSTKKLYERVSLTAYFKRLPRPEENAIAMHQQREIELQRKLMPLPQQMQQYHHQQQQQQQQQQQHHHHQGQQFPAHHGKHPMAKQQKQPKGIEIVPGKNGGVKVYKTHGHHGSPKSSHSSSIYSEDDSYFTDGSENTPNSSIDSSHSSRHRRRRSHSRSRSRHRRHDRPEQYGIEAPRRHSKHDQHYILDGFTARVPVVPRPPSPPVALPPPIDVARIEDEAYLEGRAAALADVRALEDTYRPRFAPPPRVIQRRPSVRLVEPRDAARQRHEEELGRFEHLQLSDELRYEDGLRYEEDLERDIREAEMRRRYALTDRLRRQRPEVEVWEGEPSFEDRAARDYTRHRDSEPHVQFANPFTPLAARGRRHSSYYPEYHI